MGSAKLNHQTAALFALGTVYAGVCLFNCRLAAVLGKPDITATGSFLFQFSFLALLYVVGILVVFRGRLSSRAAVLTIVIFAAIFRVFLVPTEPVLSDDIYRYIWDGRVQASGINPYLHPPSAEELSPLRDTAIHTRINRPDSPTVYPAGAQMFFFILSRTTGGGLYAFKAVMVFFDCLAIVLLALLLEKRGMSGARVLAYAWNPLVLYEIAQSGHLEGLVAFLVVLALYLRAGGKTTAGVLVVSLAASVKLYPALLLPAFLNKGERLGGAALFVLPIAVLYLPYSFSGADVAGFLPSYMSDPHESFNLGLKYLFMSLFRTDYHLTSLIFVAIILCSAAIVFFREKGGPSERYAFALAGIFTVFMPVALHPWYVVWLVPFLALYPSPAWISFSLLVPLSYLKYASPGGIMPLWVLLTEYVPLFALLFASFLIGIYRRYSRQFYEEGGQCPT